MSYALGVDLGSSFTAAAISRDGAHAEMVSLGESNMVIPSVVFATSDARLLTGDVAARRALTEPDRAAREFKRRLGDPTPLILGGVPYSPEALMAVLLADVVAAVTHISGESPERMVLTHPAVWGPYRIERFGDVPRLAGIDNVHMATEALAAAVSYTANRPLPEGAVIAVYDVGGGASDAAVLRQDQGEMHLIGSPEGVSWVGGSDFDDAILAHVNQAMKGAVEALDLGEHDAAVALARLRSDCTLAKEALSFDDESTISVFLPGIHQSIRLTRVQLDAMVRPTVSRTVNSLTRTLRSAGLTAADLSAVLLTGGSSRMPVMAEMVGSAAQRSIVVDAQPQHGAALGAALLATRLTLATNPAQHSEGRAG